ncbi:MAG TPA: SDR family oxidoreductase [Puia sp.]|nr:SDR family oxidoreductase [Puia sp.]
MKKFKDRIAVVTGGNSGIGYATAKELIDQGAKVIITGKRPAAVEEAAAGIGAVPIVADQASLSDTDRLVAEVGNRFGKVDILFINAGIGGFSPLAVTDEKLFDNVLNVNFKGAFFTLSKFVPLLNDGASVVVLSSIAATMSMSNSAVYSASKAALNSIAKIAAAELAPRKIRVNIISPGLIQTPIMSKQGWDEATVETMTESMIASIPLAKIGAAEEVAKMVAYLSGEDASFITGSEFIIDGGRKL